jgi:hypothetical protein
MRRVLALFGLVAIFMTALVPAAAAGVAVDDEDAVILTGRAHVDEGEEADAVVAFDGPAVIEGTVDNVVAFNGDITITGMVRETAIAFNGQVRVESGGMVHGDVYSSKKPFVDPNATVDGNTGRFNVKWFEAPFNVFSRVAFWLAVSVSTLILGGILLLLGPKALDAAVPVRRHGVGAAIGMGLALFIGLPILAIVAMITVVALPFGLGLLFSLALIYAVGYVFSAWLLGRMLVGESRGRGIAFLAGWGVLRLIALVPVLGGLMWFAATVFGLGVLIVEMWRAREPKAAPAQVAAAG